jgi:predicted metal-dependent hydrolase
MAGLLLATLTLGAFWLFATRRLLAQDGSSLREAMGELRAIAKNAPQRAEAETEDRSILTGVFGRGILEYLRPGFHPNDHDHTKLIAEALARLASEGVIDGEADTEMPEVAA